MRVSPEVLRKAEQGLNDAVYALTWAGALWGRTGAIRVSRLRSRFLKAIGDTPAGLSALSSTYYTASGNAFSGARFYPIGWAKILCLARGIFWLCRAMLFSNKLERKAGLAGMSADQLDIRQSILRKARRYDGALRCIEEALSRQDILENTRALLEVGKIETLDMLQRFEEASAIFHQSRAYFSEHRERQLPHGTRARVHRAFGEHLKRSGDIDAARAEFVEALRIAKSHGLGDQVLKVRARLLELDSGG